MRLRRGGPPSPCEGAAQQEFFFPEETRGCSYAVCCEDYKNIFYLFILRASVKSRSNQPSVPAAPGMHRPQTAAPASDQRGVSCSLRLENQPDLAGASDAASGGAGKAGLRSPSPLLSPALSAGSFEPSELKCVNTLSGHHSGIRAIAVHGGRVFTGSYDNTIKVWNLDWGLCEATLEGHVAWVRCLLAHAREPLLFSGSDDGLIKVWRVGPAEHGCKLQTSLLGHCLQPALEPPPPAAANCRGTGGNGAEPEGPPSRPQSAGLVPRGSGSGGSGTGGGILSLAVDYTRGWLLAGSHGAIIYVWALPAFTLLLKLRGHRSAVKQLVLHGDCLLSGSYDRTIKMWSMQHRVSLSPSPLPLGILNGGLTLPARNPQGQSIGSISTRGSVWALAVHQSLAIGAVGDSSIKVWSLPGWSMAATLSGHRGLVLALDVQGDRLFSGSDDRSVRIWRLGSWRCERVLTGHNGGVVGLRVMNGCLISASNDSFIKVCNEMGFLWGEVLFGEGGGMLRGAPSQPRTNRSSLCGQK